MSILWHLEWLGNMSCVGVCARRPSYREQVSARPLLVLVHGTRFDSRAWDGYAELVPDAEVVAVDLPGHGARAGLDYTTEAAVAAIDDAILSATGPAATESAGEPRAVVLAGHSLGGYAAVAYAQQHPARLSALVLIGAAADPSRHRVLTGLYTGFARLLPVVGAERMARGVNAILRRLGVSPQLLPAASAYAVLPQAWTAVIAEARISQLADVGCPVYLVGGQFDQLRVDTRAYAGACADARVRTIKGATHLAPMTHAREVAAVLREAVARVRPSASSDA